MSTPTPKAERLTFSMPPAIRQAFNAITLALIIERQKPISASEVFCEIARSYCKEHNIDIEG